MPKKTKGLVNVDNNLYTIMLAGKQSYITLYDQTEEGRSALARIPVGVELKVTEQGVMVSGAEWRQAEFNGVNGYVKLEQLKPK